MLKAMKIYYFATRAGHDQICVVRRANVANGENDGEIGGQ